MKTLSRVASLAGIALCAAAATAQTYPVEFDVTQSVTNVLQNTAFFVNIVARSTDGQTHPLSLVDLNVQWDPALFTPLDNGAFDRWYTPENGFNFLFAPTGENADGAQMGLIGGNSGLSPANISITSAGVAIMQLRFTSLAATGTGMIKLPQNYASNEVQIQYNDAGGIETVFGNSLGGLNGGTVNVNPLPEPMSIAALAMGIAALVRRSRVRR
ncbi:MAG: hypothetical protein ACYC96_03675 [Fimbriimonadaceae bacterium]